jgi:hypothetical protein
MSTFGITPFDISLVNGYGVGWIDEVPTGPRDGSNVTFTLRYIPRITNLPIPEPRQVIMLFKNGKKLRRFDATAQGFTPEGGDYSVSGNVITMAKAPKAGDLLDITYFPDRAAEVGGSITSFDVVLESAYTMDLASADVPAFDISYQTGPWEAPVSHSVIGGFLGSNWLAGTVYEDTDPVSHTTQGWFNRQYVYTFDPGGTLDGVDGPYPDPRRVVTEIRLLGSLPWTGPPYSLWIVKTQYIKITYANGTIEYYRPSPDTTLTRIFGGDLPGDYIGPLPDSPMHTGREDIYEANPLNVQGVHTSGLSEPTQFIYVGFESAYNPGP